MRFEVAHITVEGAQAALRLDKRKSAADIRAIVAKRGMGALAALDEAMERQSFDDSAEASWTFEALKLKPDMFEVSGLAFDGVTATDNVLSWEAN